MSITVRERFLIAHIHMQSRSGRQIHIVKSWDVLFYFRQIYHKSYQDSSFSVFSKAENCRVNTYRILYRFVVTFHPVYEAPITKNRAGACVHTMRVPVRMACRSGGRRDYLN